MDNLFVFMVGCSWLAARHTQLLCPCVSSKGQGQNIGWKNLLVKLKAVRSLTHYCHRKNLDLGKVNLICCQLKIE